MNGFSGSENYMGKSYKVCGTLKAVENFLKRMPQILTLQLKKYSIIWGYMKMGQVSKENLDICDTKDKVSEDIR